MRSKLFLVFCLFLLVAFGPLADGQPNFVLKNSVTVTTNVNYPVNSMACIFSKQACYIIYTGGIQAVDLNTGTVTKIKLDHSPDSIGVSPNGTLCTTSPALIKGAQAYVTITDPSTSASVVIPVLANTPHDCDWASDSVLFVGSDTDDQQVIKIAKTNGLWAVVGNWALPPSYGANQIKALSDDRVILVTGTISQTGDVRILKTDGATKILADSFLPGSLALSPDKTTAYACSYYTNDCIAVNTIQETATASTLKAHLGYAPFWMSWPNTADNRYAYTAWGVGPDGVNLVQETVAVGRPDAVETLGLAAFSTTAADGSTVDTVYSLRNGVLNKYTVTQPLMEYAVVNAADGAGGAVSPLEIASIYGANMSAPGSSCIAAAQPLPTTLCGTQVLVGGTPAPLFFVSPGQINFQIPSWIAGGKKVGFQVNYGGTTTPPFGLPIATATPALFTGNGLVAVNADKADWTTLQGMTNQIAVFYANGLGATAPQVPSGVTSPGLQPHEKPATIAGTLSMSICGVQLTGDQIFFAGLTPGLTGLYQINARVPSECGNAAATQDQSTLVQVAVQ